MTASIILLILLIIASIPLLRGILLSDKYAAYVNAIKTDEFFGAKLFGLGFACIEMLKVDFTTDNALKIRSEAGDRKSVV